MFFQVDGNRGRSRAVFFLIIFFILFFGIPMFRDKSLNFTEIILDPHIKSSSNISYVTLFPTKTNPYYSKKVFSLIKSSDKFLIIEGNVSSSSTTATFDERFHIKRLFVSSESWYNAGLIEGYVTSQNIQSFIVYLRKLKKVLCNIAGVNETIINNTIKSYVNEIESYDYEIMQHLNGILEGYNMKENLSKLSMEDLFLINMLWEIDSYILNGYDISKVDNLTLNDLVKFLILKGEASASFLHFHNEFLSNQILLNYFQYTPIPISYRFYKWYRIKPNIKYKNDFQFEYKFVSYPGQIVSTESISSLSNLSTVISTKRITQFNQNITIEKKPDFIKIAEIIRNVSSISMLKDKLSNMFSNSGSKFLIIESKGCSYMKEKCNVDVLENFRNKTYSKTLPWQSFFLSTPKPIDDIIYKESNYESVKNILNDSLYSEEYLKRYFKTTLSISDAIYLLKSSFISNIRHIISMVYEEYGLIISDMDDRIEIY